MRWKNGRDGRENPKIKDRRKFFFEVEGKIVEELGSWSSRVEIDGNRVVVRYDTGNGEQEYFNSIKVEKD